VRYAFIREHESQYAARTTENRRLLGQIKQCWIQSGTVYGHRKLSDDLQDMGEHCGEQRARRLMKANG
jgi:putative transposase